MSSARKPGGARPKKTRPARTPAARKSPKRRTAPAAPAGRPAGRTIVIEQYVSGIGCQLRQKKTLRALGLRHPRHRVVRPDNPAVRGMVNAIRHLVRIVEDGHAA